MGRRKYIFADRAEAEAAYTQATENLHIERRGIDAIINGDVEKWWTKGQYRLGIINSDGDMDALIALEYTANNGRKQTQFHYLADLMNAFGANDKELQQLIREARYFREAALKKKYGVGVDVE